MKPRRREIRAQRQQAAQQRWEAPAAGSTVCTSCGRQSQCGCDQLERCRDCGLSLAPGRLLYCCACAPAHIAEV